VDSLKYPARLVIKDREKIHAIKDQLKVIKELGQKEYIKINPLKPAPALGITSGDKLALKAKPLGGGPYIRPLLLSSAL
jgi:hypothetical protein